MVQNRYVRAALICASLEGVAADHADALRLLSNRSTYASITASPSTLRTLYLALCVHAERNAQCNALLIGRRIATGEEVLARRNDLDVNLRHAPGLQARWLLSATPEERKTLIDVARADPANYQVLLSSLAN